MKRNVPRKTTKMLAIPGSTRIAVPQAKLIKKCNPATQIKVSIYARRNPAAPGKDPASLEAMNLELPRERLYVSDTDFNSTFGADPADLDKIAAWAKKCKLKVLDSSVAKRRVLVQGSILDINKAFGVQLNEYEHPETGRFRGRVGQVHVPAELYDVIQGVFGLDTRPVGKPRRRRSNFKPADFTTWQRFTGKGKKGGHPRAATANPFPGTFFPIDLAQLYSYPAALNGSGQNVGIFAFNGGNTPDPHGGYKLAALQNYFEKVIGGTTPKITEVVVQGPGNDPGPDSQASSGQGDSTGEVMLDLCVVGSVAPAANIFMYFTEFTSQGWVDALNEAITDANNIAVISISYGNPEDDPDGAWTAMGVQQVNQALQGAAAKGITVCCASGDDGSADQVPSGAHVDFPASSPNVLGVGGTKVVASSAATPAIASEEVWNETMQSEGATGGGVSAVFTKPAYQNSVNVPPSANPPHQVGRGVPDVAADADPETGVVVMHVDGKQLEVIGGTSAAAPMWASLVLRLNQGLNARCGFLNPLLYGKFATGVLHDITVGNNGAYSAGSGWDACTGLGSPNGDGLLSALSGTTQQAKSAGSESRKK
jgi:kumamolisin